MNYARIPLFLVLLLGLSGAAHADLDSKAWSKLRKEWNRQFRMNAPDDIMLGMMRGEFPEGATDQIAELMCGDKNKVLQAQKLLKETIKDIEAFLEQKIAGKHTVLENLRNADDVRALKLLVTTIRLASSDIAVCKKVIVDLDGEIKKVQKGLTKNDQGGWSGDSKTLAGKMHKMKSLGVCKELIPPCITHSLAVKRAAFLGFSGARGDKAVGWLVKDGLKDRDWEVRTGVVEALGEIDHPEAVKALEKALGDKDAAVRTTAVNSLVAKEAKGSKKAILKCLGDKNWEVRVAVLEAIEAFEYRDVETLDALIEAMQKEEGRLCDDYEQLLLLLTGKSYYGDPDLWKRWWGDNREKYAAGAKGGEGSGEGEPASPPPPPPENKEPQATCSFYGIQTKSHKIIYVLDCSGSMSAKVQLENMLDPKGPVVTGSGGGRKSPDPDPGDRPQGDTRLDVLKWQLKRSIRQLPHKATFNIIFYSDVFQVWSEKMLRATPTNKKKAFDYIDGQKAEGRTNIFDPLEKAFEIAGPAQKAGGAGDPRYASPLGGADTFFLLSDGSPNAGRIPDPPGILAEVRKINQIRKVVIHTVVVGTGDNRPFMETLAKDNGGKVVVVK